MIETHMMVVCGQGEIYRLKPNPDTDIGYAGGAYLAIGMPSETIHREVFLSPDVLADLSEMLRRAALEAER